MSPTAPNCGGASGEAATVNRALTDFHARGDGNPQEFAGGCFIESEGPDDAERRS